MVRRSVRYDKLPPSLTVTVLRMLGACRAAVVADVLTRSRPFSPTYRAGLDVLDAIDGLAEALTGQRDLFHIGGSSPNDPRRG